MMLKNLKAFIAQPQQPKLANEAVEDEGHDIIKMNFDEIFHDPKNKKGPLTPSERQLLTKVGIKDGESYTAAEIGAKIEKATEEAKDDEYADFLDRVLDVVLKFQASHGHLPVVGKKKPEVPSELDVSHENLKSLKNSKVQVPKQIRGTFNCSFNNLENLQGAPQEVGEHFYCSHNRLTSLEGGPRKVGGFFNCSSNYLRNLKGAPEEVGYGFYCYDNSIDSLEGLPKVIHGVLDLRHNHLRVLSDEDKERILSVKGLEAVYLDDARAEEEINKELKKRRAR